MGTIATFFFVLHPRRCEGVFGNDVAVYARTLNNTRQPPNPPPSPCDLPRTLRSSPRRRRRPPDQRTMASPSPKLLPILIIPGFMSSGLEIKESDVKPNWVDKRVWINLTSLGMSAMYFGGAQRKQQASAPAGPPSPPPSKKSVNGDDEEQEQQGYKSAWLTHMMLSPSDMRTEPRGIKVRPIPNLEGVDYLSPGALTSHVSYVFGPVIVALQREGYNPPGGPANLMASTYDWRLPPSELERRDGYFTRTIGLVEGLYKTNGSTPVVLLGHSLGCKTAHYFLNFAKARRGQKWIDRHVHTYLPVGAPHLGAPKALRSTISGDKMGLDAFLSDEEALALGRTFGSGPWLLPRDLPDGVPASSYVLPHGVLQVSFPHAVNANPLVGQRDGLSRPSRYQMQVVARKLGDQQQKQQRRVVKTPFYKVSDDLGPDVVTFTDKISFATQPKPAPDAVLYFLLQEPGLAAAKKDKQEMRCNPLRCILMWLLCCCICDLIYKLLRTLTCGIIRGATLAADAISSTAGGGSTLAFSEGIKVPPAVWNGRTVTLKVPVCHAEDYGQEGGFLSCLRGAQPRTTIVHVQLKWHPYTRKRSNKPICSPICQPGSDTPALPIESKGQRYQEYSGYDILEREGVETTLKIIKEVYDGDKLLPRSLSSAEAPPVKRIHAIYGVNLPTEIGAVYSRQDTCLSESKLESMYAPDSNATLGVDKKAPGYSLKGGILMETPATRQTVAGNRQVSGDGTVPYWSLQHCKTWHGPGHTVTVHELDKADHREILADARFHDALLKYVKQA